MHANAAPVSDGILGELRRKCELVAAVDVQSLIPKLGH